jgi:hypothetical protein
MSLRMGANSFLVDMNAARMLLSIGLPKLARGQYSMRCFARATHFPCATTPRGAVAPRRRGGPYRWKAEVMVAKEAAFPSAGRPSNCSAVPSRE